MRDVSTGHDRSMYGPARVGQGRSRCRWTTWMGSSASGDRRMGRPQGGASVGAGAMGDGRWVMGDRRRATGDGRTRVDGLDQIGTTLERFGRRTDGLSRPSRRRRHAWVGVWACAVARDRRGRRRVTRRRRHTAGPAPEVRTRGRWRWASSRTRAVVVRRSDRWDPRARAV